MKSFIVSSLAALLLMALTAMALPPTPYSSYSTSATNNGTVTAWATISANSVNGGTPVVTFLQAGCNTNAVTATAGYLLFYKIIDTAQANRTNTTVSLPVAATNTFASGDLVLVRHLSTDTYERLSLTTATSGTNLTTTAAPQESVVPGDLIYRLSTTNAPVITLQSQTNTITGSGGIISGQRGMPLHCAITGLNAAVINALSARFDP